MIDFTGGMRPCAPVHGLFWAGGSCASGVVRQVWIADVSAAARPTSSGSAHGVDGFSSAEKVP